MFVNKAKGRLQREFINDKNHNNHYQYMMKKETLQKILETSDKNCLQ